MSTRVNISQIEDTRKLVARWLRAGARVTRISEDTEDNIMWMTLECGLGRLQLRRDCYPLQVTAPAHEVWNVLDKIPGSPYRVDDDSWSRGADRQEVIDLYDQLWHKYYHADWKRLDFLLGERETYDGGLGDGLKFSPPASVRCSFSSHLPSWSCHARGDTAEPTGRPGETVGDALRPKRPNG